MDQADKATPAGASGILSLPTTQMGTWSARLLLAALVLVTLNAAVVMPLFERRPGFELPLRIFNVIVALSVLSAGVTGLIAFVRNRERSWVVIVSILVLVAVLTLMIQDLITPG